MSSEGELPVRSEDADAVIGFRNCRSQKKRRLAEVRPVGEARHLFLSKIISIDNDRERVAFRGSSCKDIYLIKRITGGLMRYNTLNSR